MLEMDRQCALDQSGPALQQVAMALQQVGQRLNQLCLQKLAEPGQGQHPACLQPARLGLQRLLGVIGGGQRRPEQAFAGAVALQGVEDERLLIRRRRLQRLEEHFQALAEEVSHRMT